jgi:glutamine amidotransferase
MIGIVSYGLGNVQSFIDSFSRLDKPVVAVTTPSELFSCERLILPGVGSFDLAMQRLNSSGLRSSLDDIHASGKTPILGVCVGMQMLYSCSAEGNEPGLGWLSGTVERLTDPQSADIRLPHMGWNSIEVTQSTPLLEGLFESSYYFLHSYFVLSTDPHSVLACSTYGQKFAAVVQQGSLMGVQFHPEKSHLSGLKLLENFAKV